MSALRKLCTVLALAAAALLPQAASATQKILYLTTEPASSYMGRGMYNQFRKAAEGMGATIVPRIGALHSETLSDADFEGVDIVVVATSTFSSVTNPSAAVDYRLNTANVPVIEKHMRDSSKSFIIISDTCTMCSLIHASEWEAEQTDRLFPHAGETAQKFVDIINSLSGNNIEVTKITNDPTKPRWGNSTAYRSDAAPLNSSSSPYACRFEELTGIYTNNHTFFTGADASNILYGDITYNAELGANNAKGPVGLFFSSADMGGNACTFIISDASPWTDRSPDGGGGRVTNIIASNPDVAKALLTNANPTSVACTMSKDVVAEYCTCPDDVSARESVCSGDETPTTACCRCETGVVDDEGKCVDYVPQRNPEKLVCSAGETGIQTKNAEVRVLTSSDWSVRGYGASSEGGGAWIPAHQPQESEYSERGWTQFREARWLSPGRADSDPPIDTTHAYLFARAVRLGKVVDGPWRTPVGPNNTNTSWFRVDGRINNVWVTTNWEDASVDTSIYDTAWDGKVDVFSSGHGNVQTSTSQIKDWAWTKPTNPGETVDNWIIFQVKNGADKHTTDNTDDSNPLGLTAGVSLTAKLDCDCPSNKEQDGEGNCVCPANAPDDVNGTCYPACPAGSGKVHDETNGACVCPGGKEEDGNGVCVCPSDKPDEVGGTCYPACPAGKVHDVNDGSCVCPDDKPLEVDGVCTVPVCDEGQDIDSPCTCEAPMVDDGNGFCVTPPVPPQACADGQAIASGCTCVAPMVDDGNGICIVSSPICAPSGNCSSAPVAGWPALLGLGAALPLLARRRRRK